MVALTLVIVWLSMSLASLHVEVGSNLLCYRQNLLNKDTDVRLLIVWLISVHVQRNEFFMFFREDWKPVLTINSIIYGLQYLFLVSIYIILM